MEPQHIFHRLPVELVVKIYKSMDDAGDVKATLSTCRRAKAIFDDNAGVIAKSHLLRRLHPSNIKLMVMAVASRDVDPQDEESIERFYRPPGRNSQTLRQTPHVEWVDKYWDVFSHVELEAVLWTRLPFNLCFSDGACIPTSNVIYFVKY
ncbi:hypothetical protein F5B19DRAFT_345747 [Rostrohypoxylon terebratum]|nr:hypothetical protein F5B19DRAFT_345747 [Rostrohypoxylon terebratum]